MQWYSNGPLRAWVFKTVFSYASVLLCKESGRESSLLSETAGKLHQRKRERCKKEKEMHIYLNILRRDYIRSDWELGTKDIFQRQEGKTPDGWLASRNAPHQPQREPEAGSYSKSSLEWTYGCQGWGGDRLGVWVSRCKLLHMRRINNKVLLGSKGNYIRYPVTSHRGKEYEKRMYVYI